MASPERKAAAVACSESRPRGSLEAVRRIPVLAGAAALASISLLFSACGDGPDATGTPTAAAAATTGSTSQTTTTGTTAVASGTAARTPAATRAANDYGPEPTLGGNITKIAPAWGQKVSQASTRSPDAGRPGGICAEVNFNGLPENALWFRMAVNGVEVTQRLTWVAASQDATEGKMCFAPVEGLPTGRIQAAIAVQNPNNAQETTRQVVAWEFDVQ